MTRFLSVRTQDVGGACGATHAIESNGSPSYTLVADRAVAADVAGRDVVLAFHGFNVSRKDGVAALAGLEAMLRLPPNFRFFGVLWPGDFWLPAINYPWEASTATRAGGLIADYCNSVLAPAASISMVSHSLGGRVLLTAATRLSRLAGQLVVAAAAVDDDCLYGQFDAARRNCQRLSVLSSVQDYVLRLAYPAGDFVSDVFLGDSDSPWRGALGLKGPRMPYTTPVSAEAIPSSAKIGHLDYLPRSVPTGPVPPDTKWAHTAGFMSRALQGQPGYWA